MLKAQWLRLTALIAIVAVFIAASTLADPVQLLRDARAGFESLGAFGPLLFALIYGALGALAAPTGLIEVLAGVIFGFTAGAAAVVGGASLAAVAGFACGRWVARDWVNRRLANNRRAEQIQAAVAERGVWITALIRLSPAVPFNLTSFVLGASRIRFAPFLVASLLGMLPIKLLLVWLGASGQQWLQNSHPGEWTTRQWAFYSGGALVTVIVVLLIGWIIARSTRQILQRAPDG